MCTCGHSLLTLAFLSEKLLQPQFYKDLTRKTAFFEGWSLRKFNNLRLAPGTNLKFYASVAKVLKLKVRRFLGLVPTFAVVTGKKLLGGGGEGGSIFAHHSPYPSWIGLITMNWWTIESIRSKIKIISLGSMYQLTKILRTLGAELRMEIKFPAYGWMDQLSFKTEISGPYNQLSKQMNKWKRKQRKSKLF